MLVEPTQLSIMPNLACVIAQNIVCLFEILNLIKAMFATDVFICQNYKIILVFQQFSLSLYIPENTGIFFINIIIHPYVFIIFFTPFPDSLFSSICFFSQVWSSFTES